MKGYRVDLYVNGKFFVGVRVFASTKDEAWVRATNSPAYTFAQKQAALERVKVKRTRGATPIKEVNWEVYQMTPGELQRWVRGR